MLSSKSRTFLKLTKFRALSQSYALNFSNLKDSSNPQKPVYDSIVRSSTVSKNAMKSFLEGQDLMAYFPMQDPVRKLNWEQEEDLKKWEEVLVEDRVRPSLLLPLINTLFFGIGVASGFLGRNVTVRVCVVLEKILEDYHDECLRILNENNIDEKNLRKMLCDIRDKGYDINSEIMDNYQIKHTPIEERIAEAPRVVLKKLFELTRKL